MINLANVQDILVDAHPYVLIFLVISISLSLLTGNQVMFDSVVNYIWRNSSSSSTSSRPSRKLEKSRSDAPRSRAQQIAARTDGSSNISSARVEAEYYPGLVNMSGTYCFLNSPLQVRRDVLARIVIVLSLRPAGVSIACLSPAPNGGNTRESRGMGRAYARFRRCSWNT